MKALLPDKAYEILKWIALICVPTIGEAYVRLANVWHLPLAQEINETALIITFVIGALIGVSTISYRNKIDADIKQIGEDIAEELNDGETESE